MADRYAIAAFHKYTLSDVTTLVQILANFVNPSTTCLVSPFMFESEFIEDSYFHPLATFHVKDSLHEAGAARCGETRHTTNLNANELYIRILEPFARI